MGFLTILTIVVAAFSLVGNCQNDSFDAYYNYLWGGDHFYINPQRTEVQLKMDRSSGAGFRSKYSYQSGQFRIKMKIPDRKTGGIVTSFYLTEAPDNVDPGNHFEIDFEFLGTYGVVQTNVYDNDTGHREQSFKLWFDPSQDYHTYEFLWNSHLIVFSVDGIPIRVFKNNMGQGVAYPNRPMHIEASIWDADWAGNVIWENGPFVAHYTDFGFYGCLARGGNVNAESPEAYVSCDSERYYWNRVWQLNATQMQQMAYYRRYITYDYCSDPKQWKKECSLN